MISATMISHQNQLNIYDVTILTGGELSGSGQRHNPLSRRRNDLNLENSRRFQPLYQIVVFHVRDFFDVDAPDHI